jgi:threonine dehydrogenase-like Zn-dependent dehydrogenase
VEIPPSIPDESAIFIEPLAAALEILDQTVIDKETSVLLVGDGKLALLIAQVMNTTGCDLMVLGKHPEKLTLLDDAGIKTSLLPTFKKRYFDVVIEAAGNPSALDLGLACVRPRGIFILKSTYSNGFLWNPSSVVVDEITIIGSRCGNFQKAMAFLEQYRPALGRMISGQFCLEDAVEAFEYSARPDALKVLLRIG